MTKSSFKKLSISERFKFKIRNTNLKKELLGGLVTFFAMVYILPVNQSVLSDTGMPKEGIFVATAITAAVSSIIIGLFSNMPLSLAPGMGSNAFFAATMVKDFHIPWQQALFVVFISAFIFTLLAIFGVIEKFIKSIPHSLKVAMSVGLGLFITFIGLNSAGIIETNNGLSFGELNSVPVILGLVGIIMVFALSMVKRVKNIAIFVTMISMVFIALTIGEISSKAGVTAYSDIKFDLSNLNQVNDVFGQGFTQADSALVNPKVYASIFALLFMSVSGSAGTVLAIGQSANIMKENGEVEGQKAALISTGVAGMLAGSVGTTTTGAYLESTAGVAAGARTGVSSIFTGLMFAISIVLLPIFKPFSQGFITAPALVYVGAMMFTSVKKIDMSDYASLISSFVLIIIMAFAQDILSGIAFGFVTYLVLKAVSRQWKDINVYTIVFTVLFLTYLISKPFIL